MRARYPLALIAVVGCSSSSNTPVDSNPANEDARPDALPVPRRLYVAQDGMAGGVMQFTLPLTTTSTADFTISVANMASVAIDRSGTLAAAGSTGAIRLFIFTPPLSSSSTASAMFTNETANGNGQVVFSKAGDLFSATMNTTVNVFHPPFTSASVPSSSIGSGITYAMGATFDTAGNLYVIDAKAGTNARLQVYAPPYTAAPVVTGLRSSVKYNRLAVSATQLFVASDAGATGAVDVYTLPITSTSTPAFALTSAINVPEGLSVDADGKLYVGNKGNHTISVFTPPVTSTSVPLVSLTVGATGFQLSDVTIGL